MSKSVGAVNTAQSVKVLVAKMHDDLSSTPRTNKVEK